MDKDTKTPAAPKRGKWDTFMTAEEVRREQRRENLKFWLWYFGMGLLAALSATAYWWIWIVLGLFIQSR